MTAAVNKLQRILGSRRPQGLRRFIRLPEAERPVVFVTHMEHHSNHTSWYETVADVVVVPPDEAGVVDLDALEGLLPAVPRPSAQDRRLHRLFQRHRDLHALPCDGEAVCTARAASRSIDFSASAAYVPIDMHPADAEERLDAVLFSPHKFLGGPGSAGVLIFDRALYHNTVPDEAGGGTVAWTNPWGQYCLPGRHRSARGRRHARLPPDDQGRAGGTAQGA